MAVNPHLPTRTPRTRSVSEWFRKHCRPLPVLLGIAVYTGPLLPHLLEAAPPRFVGKDANPKPTPADQANAERPPVKINYTLPTTWDKILKDIAEQTNSTLVADRVPKGTYSRRDRNEYTREDALRIINQEIEKLGFRALEKGEFIVVVDLPSQRPSYERSTVTAPKPWQPPAPFTPLSNTAPTRKFDSVTPPNKEDVQQAAAQKSAPKSTTKSPVSQASYEEGGGVEAGRTSSEELLLEGDATSSTADVPSVVVYRARNQKASTLAKHVFKTFRDRSELLEAGRNGLPAFRVRSTVSSANGSPLQFSMAIDEAREELVIDAPPSEADAVLALLRLLDSPTLEEEPVRLVSTTRTACEVAMQFDQQSERLQAARGARAGMNQFAQADAPAAPAAEAGAPADGAATPMGQLPKGPLGDVIGNLKGEVNIESVPDLGVLILKGNQADVEQVMRVIRELETLSEQTAPQLELLFLRNANSDALAQLLTTVYESLTKFPGKATQPRQSVAILPVSKPNAILIVAPMADVAGIKSLAEELDKPVDPETEFQVFHLQTAVATQVQTMLTDFYTDRPGLGTRVIVRSDARTNSLIVSARPNDLDEVATLIRKIDQDSEVSASQLKVFPLQNAVATELAAVLNLSIQSVLSPPSTQGTSSVFGTGGGGGSAQVDESFRAVRSSVLQFLAIDAAGERMLRSGVLADIRITPDPRMNALLVSAPESSLSLIAELIRQLDKPTSQVAEIKVFTLANADAQLMIQQLQGLFNVSTTGQGGAQRQQTGIQVAGAEDASSGLIPLRFSVDTRTNSVIAIGGGDALRVVEAIMLRLDESDIRERRNTIYRLKNSPSDSIAQAVTSFFTSQSQLATNDPNLFSTVEQLEREVIVVSEPVSNSLLISATPRYNDEILRLIEKLDAAPQQVIIQALLVEVELNDTDEFGIELGFQDSILFNRSIIDAANTFTTTTTTTQNNTTVTQTNIISQAASPGFLFGNPNTPLGNNVGAQNPGRVGSQGLSNFSVGRTNGDLGFGGLVLSASSESVSFLLRALAENRQVRVLSRPQIRTLDNQQAQIQQGQNVPVVRGVTVTATGTNPNIERDDAGVILTVTPRISPDGNVVMALTAEKSQYNLNNGVPVFTDANTGNVITSPVKDISTALTTISVPSGQTVVMGGLITSRTDEIHRKVPWLGDIPILGYAFRYDYLQTRRTELLIFLTPRIIWDDMESEHIKDVEMARVHFIEAAAEEMHGPLRGVPAEGAFLRGGGYDPNCPVPVDGLPPGAVIESIVPVTPEAAPTLIPTPPEPAIPPAPPAPGTAKTADPSAVIPVRNTNPAASGPRSIAPDAAATPAVPPPPPETEEARRARIRKTTDPSGWQPTPREQGVIPAGGTTTTGTGGTSQAIQQMSAEFIEPPKKKPATAPAGKASLTAEPPPADSSSVKLGRKSWLGRATDSKTPKP